MRWLASSDGWQVNDYSWCGDSSFTVSDWDDKVKNYTDYSVPIFLSEYGCNKPSPRKFTEVKTLYSKDMTSVFSGGLVYEYSQEPNNFGLVEISSDRKSVDKLGDFDALKKQYAAAKNPEGDGGFQENLPPSKCPSKSSEWEASNDLPSMPQAAEQYYVSPARDRRTDQRTDAD